MNGSNFPMTELYEAAFAEPPDERFIQGYIVPADT
jgi:hypothetical protein